MNILLKPIYKLGDWLVKRDMDKWAKSPYPFDFPILAFGENPDATSHFATAFAIEDYFKNKQGE